jgi:hypothetical protein
MLHPPYRVGTAILTMVMLHFKSFKTARKILMNPKLQREIGTAPAP